MNSTNEDKNDHQSMNMDCERPIGLADVDNFITAKFSIGQKVFAKESGNLYEAVIRKSMLKTDPNNHWSYFVHYLGWNSRWDKWMTERELEEDTFEVRTRAEKAKEEAKKAEILKKDKKRELEKEKKERKLKKIKKQKTIHNDNNDSDLSMTSTYQSRNVKKSKISSNNEDIKCILTSCCELPFTLKTVLLDDREKITVPVVNFKPIKKTNKIKPNRLVHTLPVCLNVKVILAQFMKIKQRELNEKASCNKETDEVKTHDDSAEEMDSTEELKKWKSFEQGILNLFDEMLPKYLLYNEEREQYLHLFTSYNSETNFIPSEIYPGEFLLRMMVRLPVLLSTSLRVKMMWDEEHVHGELCDLRERLKELLVFLQKNRVSCFKGRYRYINEEEYTLIERDVIMRSKVV